MDVPFCTEKRFIKIYSRLSKNAGVKNDVFSCILLFLKGENKNVGSKLQVVQLTYGLGYSCHRLLSGFAKAYCVWDTIWKSF